MGKQHTVGRLWERQPSAQQQTLPAGPDWSEGSDTPPRVLGAGEGTAPALGPGTAGEDRARARPANRPRNAHLRGPPAAPSRAHTSERGPEGLPQPSTWSLGQDTVSAAGSQGRGGQSSPPAPHRSSYVLQVPRGTAQPPSFQSGLPTSQAAPGTHLPLTRFATGEF